jgi:hypothetical protein
MHYLTPCHLERVQKALKIFSKDYQQLKTGVNNKQPTATLLPEVDPMPTGNDSELDQ